MRQLLSDTYKKSNYFSSNTGNMIEVVFNKKNDQYQ